MVNKEIPTKPTGNPTSTKEWIICLCEELAKVKGVQWYEDNKHNLKSIVQQLETLDASKIKVNIVNGIFKSNNVEDCLQDIMVFIKTNKKKIADAITSKGVSTSATASVDTMCTNIRNIKTGYAVGDVLSMDKIEYVYKQTGKFTHRIETDKTLDNLTVGGEVSSVRVDKNNNLYVSDYFDNNLSCYNMKTRSATRILESKSNSGWRYLIDCDKDNVVYTATSTISNYDYATIYTDVYINGSINSSYSGSIQVPRYIKFKDSRGDAHDFKNIREIFNDRYYVYIILIYNVSLSYRYMCVRYDKTTHKSEFLECDDLTRYSSFHMNGSVYLTESKKSDSDEYYIYTVDSYTSEPTNTDYRVLNTTKREGIYNMPSGRRFSLDSNNILIFTSYEVYLYRLKDNKSIKISDDFERYNEEVCPIAIDNYVIRCAKCSSNDKVCTYYEYQVYVDGEPLKLIKSEKLPVGSNYSSYTSANIGCIVSYQGSNTYAIYEKEQVLTGVKLK